VNCVIVFAEGLAQRHDMHGEEAVTYNNGKYRKVEIDLIQNAGT